MIVMRQVEDRCHNSVNLYVNSLSKQSVYYIMAQMFFSLCVYQTLLTAILLEVGLVVLAVMEMSTILMR